MSKSLRVVAAVIEKDGKFLITQRRPEAVLPLLWEFPGGRVSDGETDQQALKRTLKERLDAEIEVGDEVATKVHDYERYSVTLVIFQAKLLSESIRAARVNSFAWASPEELDQYEFPPADQKTMDQLLGIN
ncbi:MAG: (deoxy)nucleoside triphosphate pyrophosphohydrolase [Microbacteriaceae bacterium]|nr:(deoxy)nucleoside triphosphate pyrophosphohydrolase [Microbacteriaceae bacterium]